jgi:hypothetical protein
LGTCKVNGDGFPGIFAGRVLKLFAIVVGRGVLYTGRNHCANVLWGEQLLSQRYEYSRYNPAFPESDSKA